MAGIDKIYGTQAQYDEFRAWMQKEKPEFLNYFYARPLAPTRKFPLTNFPIEVDAWLYKNCPFSWVRAAIEEQYNGAPKVWHVELGRNPYVVAVQSLNFEHNVRLDISGDFSTREERRAYAQHLCDILNASDLT